MPISKKVAAIAPIAGALRRTGSDRILVSIKDQERNEVGRYAGWGAGEDQNARSQRDETGPSMVPLAYGTTRWGRTLGCLLIPAAIVLITVEEDVLHIPQAAGWISLGRAGRRFRGCGFLAGSPADLGVHREPVARRRHRTVQQRIVRLAHPLPELRAELALDLHATPAVPARLCLLERIGLQVVQLDHAGSVFRVESGVRAEDGAGLDVAGHLDRESRLEVADVLVAAGADAPHGVVVAVEGLLGKDRVAMLIRLAAQQRHQRAALTSPGSSAPAASRRVGRTSMLLTSADDRPGADLAARPADDQRDLEAGVVERALGARHRQAVVGREDDDRVRRPGRPIPAPSSTRPSAASICAIATSSAASSPAASGPGGR